MPGRVRSVILVGRQDPAQDLDPALYSPDRYCQADLTRPTRPKPWPPGWTPRPSTGWIW